MKVKGWKQINSYQGLELYKWVVHKRAAQEHIWGNRTLLNNARLHAGVYETGYHKAGISTVQMKKSIRKSGNLQGEISICILCLLAGHQPRSTIDCAADRTVGWLADNVGSANSVLPHNVAS